MLAAQMMWRAAQQSLEALGARARIALFGRRCFALCKITTDGVAFTLNFCLHLYKKPMGAREARGEEYNQEKTLAKHSAE
jgi:hypothetical protein